MASKTIDFLINVKGNATREVGKLQSSMGGMTKAAGMAAGAVGMLAAAATAAATAYAGLASEITGNVDKMNTLSKASGLAIQTIKGLEQAARASGKTLDQIAPKRLASNMLTAAQGSKEMADAFEMAGVAVTDAQGRLRSTDDVFRELIDSLNGMENASEKAAVASKTLGRSVGQELLSALDSSDSLDAFVSLTEKYGIRTGPDAIRATAKWQDATADLALAWDDAKQSIFDALGGSDGGAALMERMSWWVVFFGTLIKNIIDDTGERFSALFSGIGRAMEGDLMGAAIGLERFLVPDPSAIADAWTEAVERADSFLSDTEGIGPGGGGGGAGGGGTPPKEPKPPEFEIVPQFVHEISNPIADAIDAIPAGMADGFEDVGINVTKTSLQPMIDAMDRQREANAAALMGGLAGMSKIEDVAAMIPGYGQAIAAGISFIKNLEQNSRSLIKDFMSFRKSIGPTIDVVLTKVIPRFVRAMAEDFFSGRTVWWIVRAIVEAVPAIIKAMVEGFGQALKNAWEGIKNFFRGGDDRNVLTGRRGKFLGTSFKKGRFSLFGFFNRDDKDKGVKGSFATGGFVPETGIYRLHAGERVVPSTGASTGSADRAARGFMGGSPLMIGNATINVQTNDVRDMIRQIRRELGTLGTGASLTPRGA